MRFYAEVQPKRIVTHSVTYFPGTTALEHARERSIPAGADVARILDGDVTLGYMFGGNGKYGAYEDLRTFRACSICCRSYRGGTQRNGCSTSVAIAACAAPDSCASS